MIAMSPGSSRRDEVFVRRPSRAVPVYSTNDRAVRGSEKTDSRRALMVIGYDGR